MPHENERKGLSQTLKPLPPGRFQKFDFYFASQARELVAELLEEFLSILHRRNIRVDPVKCDRRKLLARMSGHLKKLQDQGKRSRAWTRAEVQHAKNTLLASVIQRCSKRFRVKLKNRHELGSLKRQKIQKIC